MKCQLCLSRPLDRRLLARGLWLWLLPKHSWLAAALLILPDSSFLLRTCVLPYRYYTGNIYYMIVDLVPVGWLIEMLPDSSFLLRTCVLPYRYTV
jgi:uncharacterized protein YceK